jgi:hypothetical protein
VDDDDSKAQAACTLEVYPYFDFSSDTAINDQRLWVRISNQGNTERSYIAEVREPANQLVIAPARTRLTAPAGGAADVTMRVYAKNPSWLGQPRRYPLEVFVRGEGLPVQTHQQYFTVNSRIPWWTLVIATIMLISFLFYLFTNVPNLP